MCMTNKTNTSIRFQHMINGKRYSKTIKIAGLTKAEINKRHSDWIVDCDQGKIAKKQYTLSEYSKKWLEVHVVPTCRPTVIKNYKLQLKNHILPKFGNKKLEQITPMIINDYILELKSKKNLQHPEKNISAGTIKKIFAVLKNIMHTAYSNDLISQDPFSKVKLSFSDMEREEKLHVWEQKEYKHVLELLQNESNDNKYVIELALWTGLRLSEIFGLDFEDVDLENGIISVEKSRQKVDGKIQVFPTKTGSSKRKITISPNTINLLKEYMETHPNNKYLFSNLDPHCVTSWFREFEKRHKLDKIRFHDLRHTHASLLLFGGVDIKTISERLGHSNIGITMNVYTHVMEELDRKASLVIDTI